MTRHEYHNRKIIWMNESKHLTYFFGSCVLFVSPQQLLLLVGSHATSNSKKIPIHCCMPKSFQISIKFFFFFLDKCCRKSRARSLGSSKALVWPNQYKVQAYYNQEQGGNKVQRLIFQTDQISSSTFCFKLKYSLHLIASMLINKKPSWRQVENTPFKICQTTNSSIEFSLFYYKSSLFFFLTSILDNQKDRAILLPQAYSLG